jgi:hypothetical protein
VTKQKPDPIPVISIIRDAIAVPWRKRATMFRALFGISVILVALNVLLQPCTKDGQPVMEFQKVISNLVLAVLSGLAFAIFAVTCHRLILLGDESVPNFGLKKWTSRETRFVGWVLLGYVCYAVIALLLSIPVLAFLLMCHLPAESAGVILGFTFMIPCTYVFARISVLLPATAVDERPNAKWASDLTGRYTYGVNNPEPSACAVTDAAGTEQFLPLGSRSLYQFVCYLFCFLFSVHYHFEPTSSLRGKTSPWIRRRNCPPKKSLPIYGIVLTMTH